MGNVVGDGGKSPPDSKENAHRYSAVGCVVCSDFFLKIMSDVLGC